MLSERHYKRVRNWSNGLLLGVGVCTLFGIGFVRLNGVQTTSESHLVRRSAEQSTQSIIHIETGYIIDNSNQEEKRYFEGVKEAKEFVKYQYPSEKFVPLDELVTVLLNGMRFYHQGEEMLPLNGTDILEPMKAKTRSNDNLRCEGRNDFKAYKKEHTTQAAMQNDHPILPDVSVQAVLSAPAKPETVPLPGNNYFDDVKVAQTPVSSNSIKGNNAANSVSSSTDDKSTSSFDPSAARSISDKNLAAQFLSYFSDDATTPANEAVNDDASFANSVSTTTTALSDAPTTKNHRIGCCNGVPYNQNKRCCCRRIAFDKEKKFCCAIDGCANFKVFDRSNPKNIDLCLSLKGLVVQEYGYTGEHTALGEPDLTRSPRVRPQ